MYEPTEAAELVDQLDPPAADAFYAALERVEGGVDRLIAYYAQRIKDTEARLTPERLESILNAAGDKELADVEHHKGGN